MGVSLFDQVAKGSRKPFILVEWTWSPGMISLSPAFAPLQANFHSQPPSPRIHFQKQAYTHQVQDQRKGNFFPLFQLIPSLAMNRQLNSGANFWTNHYSFNLATCQLLPASTAWIREGSLTYKPGTAFQLDMTSPQKLKSLITTRCMGNKKTSKEVCTRFPGNMAITEWGGGVIGTCTMDCRPTEHCLNYNFLRMVHAQKSSVMCLESS